MFSMCAYAEFAQTTHTYAAQLLIVKHIDFKGKHGMSNNTKIRELVAFEDV